MNTKRLKKVLAGFSVATLITGAGLTFTGCATTSCSGETSCSGAKQEGSQTSCSGMKEGGSQTSCSGKTSCSGSK